MRPNPAEITMDLYVLLRLLFRTAFAKFTILISCLPSQTTRVTPQVPNRTLPFLWLRQDLGVSSTQNLACLLPTGHWQQSDNRSFRCRDVMPPRRGTVVTELWYCREYSVAWKHLRKRLCKISMSFSVDALDVKQVTQVG
jgi:hypothetical protein